MGPTKRLFLLLILRLLSKLAELVPELGQFYGQATFGDQTARPAPYISESVLVYIVEYLYAITKTLALRDLCLHCISTESTSAMDHSMCA